MRTTHTHVITGLICFLLALAGVAQAQSLGGDTPTADTPVIQTTPPDAVTPPGTPSTPGDDAAEPPESTTPPDEGTPPDDDSDEPVDEYDEPDENDDTVGKAKVGTPRFTG